ncbi:MAG: prepilin-type N-terminal cleavage/methylation domain-containing protein [Phycisphaeraceae bacterium]|nr:prepilin-type N-terminal cleavage/methylation domain-containing protein [Phycisphaeraceae bacterium]
MMNSRADGRGSAGAGFTLLEVLVVVAVIAVLVGVLLPALGQAREAGRAVVCLSNLRQIGIICQGYADENRGTGPAIGQPYAQPPNWALVVQQSAGMGGSTPTELYSARGVLVCPTNDAEHGETLTRTYAMNATGHAGQPGDPDNYDTAPPARMACIRFDAVQDPGVAPLVVDSSQPPPGDDGRPQERCWSMLDFRQPLHAADRLARLHGRANGFNAVMLDGSAREHRSIPETWCAPLP